MIKKALKVVLRSWVKCTKELVVASWESHLPFRQSLLMSQ